MRIKKHPVLITLTLMLMFVVTTLFVLSDTERTVAENDEDKTELASDSVSTYSVPETGSYQDDRKSAAGQMDPVQAHEDHLGNDQPDMSQTDSRMIGKNDNKGDSMNTASDRNAHDKADYSNHTPHKDPSMDKDKAENYIAADDYEDEPQEMFDEPQQQTPITGAADANPAREPSSVEYEYVESHEGQEEIIQEDVEPEVAEQEYATAVDTYPDEAETVEFSDTEPASSEKTDTQSIETASDPSLPEATDSSIVSDTEQGNESDASASKMDSNGDMTSSDESAESSDEQSDVEGSSDYVELPAPDPEQNEDPNIEPGNEMPLNGLNSEQIMSLLASSLISESGAYTPIIDKEGFERKSIGSFGKERTNCFSVNTGASYNLWGGGRQFVIFNIEDLNDYDFLEFTICGENGTSGEMDVSIYVDHEIDESPDYNFHMSSCTNPETAQINIKGASSLGILVNNLTGHENRMVFYDLAVY